MPTPAALRRYRRAQWLTIWAVYALILVGGIVRSTGSGMGCPDWPRCFGSWVPPTDVSQLPADYKEVYTAQRVKKNQRLAKTLAALGFRQVADNIFAHPTQYLETDFNATKTWIEYLNRLLGALIGIFIVLTAVLAWPLRRTHRVVFWLSLLAVLTVGVQGWLGSLVVSTNLLPVMVTIHMGLALVLLALQLTAVLRAEPPATQTLPAAERGLTLALWAAVVVVFTQIVLGTQVRETVDQVAYGLGYGARNTWVTQLGAVFTIHRTFSALVFLLTAYVALRLYLTGIAGLRQLAAGLGAVVVAEIGVGIVLAQWALPAAAQPIHLTLGTLLFGLQFLALVRYRRLLRASRAAEVENPTVGAARAARVA